MTRTEQFTGTLNTQFSEAEAVAATWSEVRARLDEADVFLLSTVRRDGRPHVTPLPAFWLDGALHFCTGTGEQKARNLEANLRCVLSAASDRFDTGIDVVVEGAAHRELDPAVLHRLSAIWADRLDWTFDVVDGGFRDPSHGDGTDPVAVFAVIPDKILSFSKGAPFAQTRFRPA